VEQSGGYISVDSVPNEGSTFRIFLPRSAKAVAEELKAQELPPEPGRETVLLVEDEGGIRSMTRMYLESLGYKVLEAANGREAAQISRQYAHEIDLLLTDIVMPGMRGEELVDLVRRERPGIGVIYMSGYPELQGLEDGVTVLEKPFTFPELGRSMRLLLDRIMRQQEKKPPTKRTA
jgi:CheY-like chemotaxis protein